VIALAGWLTGCLVPTDANGPDAGRRTTSHPQTAGIGPDQTQRYSLLAVRAEIDDLGQRADEDAGAANR